MQEQIHCTGRAEAVEQLVVLYGRKQAGRRIGIALAMQGRVVVRLTLDSAPAHVQQ